MTQLSERSATFDCNNLYKEETFIDRRAGTIRRLSPVLEDGNPDGSRRILYVGQTQVDTERGPMPINFEIYADSFKEAIQEFNRRAEDVVRQVTSELTDHQTQMPEALPA